MELIGVRYYRLIIAAAFALNVAHPGTVFGDSKLTRQHLNALGGKSEGLVAT